MSTIQKTGLRLLIFSAIALFGLFSVQTAIGNSVKQEDPEEPVVQPECSTDLRVEVENGVLVGDMVTGTIGTDPTTTFVMAEAPEGSTGFYTEWGSREHRVDVCVNIVDRGFYHMAAWGLAHSGSNSFYITVDRDPAVASDSNERWDIDISDPTDPLGNIFQRYDIAFYGENGPEDEPRQFFLTEGEHIISFRAREAGAMVDRMRLDLVISLPNIHPVFLNIKDRYNVVDDAIDFQVRIIDHDGDPLTLTVENLPPGVVMNLENGQLSGSPIQAGEYEVSITADDGSTGVVTRSFTWTIVDTVAELPDYTEFIFLPFNVTE